MSSHFPCNVTSVDIMKNPKNTKENEQSQDPEILLLDIYPNEVKSVYQDIKSHIH